MIVVIWSGMKWLFCGIENVSVTHFLSWNVYLLTCTHTSTRIKMRWCVVHVSDILAERESWIAENFDKFMGCSFQNWRIPWKVEWDFFFSCLIASIATIFITACTKEILCKWIEANKPANLKVAIVLPINRWEARRY